MISNLKFGILEMKKIRGLFLAGVLLTVFPILGRGENAVGKLEVRSSAFGEGGSIPSDFTCDGADMSPSVSWSGAPAGTQSFAVMVDDPDAPGGNWTHWLLYDLSPKLNQLPAGIPPAAILPDGGFQGRTDFGKAGYGGPCPPAGTHRYFFKVFAIDRILHLEPGTTKKKLLAAMRGHILAEGALMGTYARS
jgi:hypothetical protein